ncbi:MAG: PEP-CTERM sorting domain-containing protein, partial [bacterium]
EINLGTSGGQGTLTATGGITIRSGQTLAGYGTVEGNTTIASGATLAPGNSPGIINIAGDLTLKSGSTSIFEVVGSGIAGAAFDQVSVTGVLTYGGVLNLAIAGNYSATAPFKGLLFDIQSGSQTGAFSQVQYKLNTGVWKDLYYYSDINTWQMWDNTAIANLADNGYVGINLNTGVLTVVPEPSTWALVVGGVSTLVILRRRKRS